MQNFPHKNKNSEPIEITSKAFRVLRVVAKNMFPLITPIKYRFYLSDDKEGGSAFSWKAQKKAHTERSWAL